MNAQQEIVREFIRRINVLASGGDADPYALLHQDVFVEVIGTTPLSGVYRGVDQVRHVLVSTAAERLVSLRAEITEIIADSHRLAVLIIITAQTVSGRIYNKDGYTDGLVFAIEGEKIKEIRVFPDTTQIETLLFDQVYVPSSRAV